MQLLFVLIVVLFLCTVQATTSPTQSPTLPCLRGLDLAGVKCVDEKAACVASNECSAVYSKLNSGAWAHNDVILFGKLPLCCVFLSSV